MTQNAQNKSRKWLTARRTRYRRVGRLQCRDNADTQYITVHKNLSKSQKWWTYKPLWQRTVHLRVFSRPTRLPMAGESIAKVPNKTAAKWVKCFSFFFLSFLLCFFLSSFRRASSTLRQPLAPVYARNSSILYWAVYEPIAFSQLRSLARRS